jgi:hypothetical protein
MSEEILLPLEAITLPFMYLGIKKTKSRINIPIAML